MAERPETAPSLRTLAELVFRLRQVAAGRPDLLSVRFAAGAGEVLSASDFTGKVHALALALEQHDAKPGERLAIWSENRPEWAIVDLAAHLAGMVVVAIEPELDDQRVGYVLRNSGARWIFYSDRDKRDRLLALAGSLATPPRPVAFEGRDVVPEGVSITRLMGQSAERRGAVPLGHLRDRVAPDDPATIAYLHRPGEPPRGVALSHRNLAAVVNALGARLPCGPADRALSFLPLADLRQRTVDYLCLAQGASICYLPSATRLAVALARVRPTLIHAAPWTFEQVKGRIEADLEQVNPWRRWLFARALRAGRRYAGARDRGFVGPLLALKRRLADAVALRRVRRRLGGELRLALVGERMARDTLAFFDALGLSLSPGLALPEASSWLTLDVPGDHRSGSLGRPLPEVELRVGPHDEILARGPGVMAGYWQDPEATAAVLDAGGWLHTGLRGRLDRRGFLIPAPP
ncbi:MAG: hypothetical protein D6696_17995 [Acidobacteria bacterium]|nr:MAG: hypothetical protein D6696_17995 [Acidobacteriota bacterium]